MLKYDNELDVLTADLLEDYGTEFVEYAQAVSQGISCVTPGNPYILHCFPAHATELTPTHRQHLDSIAGKILSSWRGAGPIRQVEIIGHSATWRGISKEEYGRRALVRAENARDQLRGRLANTGLVNKIKLTVGHRANNEPLVDNMIHSSSQVARNNRAFNRRVEITLIKSSRGAPVVESPLKNISRVWIFATANQLMSQDSIGDQWRQRVVDHGFTDVAIFVNGQPKNYIRGKQEKENYRYHRIFRNDDIIRATRNFFENKGIDIHLVTWIKPTKRYIEGCAEVTLPLCKKIGARSLLFDAEEPWYGSLKKLQLSQSKSQQIVNKYFCPAFGNNPCCLGVTHVVGDPDNDLIKRVIGPLIQACDYSLPQAYTNINKSDNCIKRPGCLQKRAAKKWSTFDRTIVMGLWALKSGDTSDWERDINVTDKIKILPPKDFVASQIQEVAYWRLNALKNPRKSKFLKSLNRRARVVRSKMSNLDKQSFDLFLCPPLLRCKKH